MIVKSVCVRVQACLSLTWMQCIKAALSHTHTHTHTCTHKKQQDQTPTHLEAMQRNDVLRDACICGFVGFINHDMHEIKARQDGGGQCNIILEGLGLWV